MVMSVNTNVAAFIALQGLSKTNAELAASQNRVNTGLRISSAKDNAAYFAIAQNLRADISGLSAATDSMNRARGVVDVALAALEGVQGLLVELKQKAVAAADPGLDTTSRNALIQEYNALSAQMSDLIATASFNGTNLISGSPATVSAIVDDTGTRTITINGTSADAQLTFSRTISTGASAATVQAQLVNIDNSITNLSSVMSTFGSKSKQLELQLSFNQKLSDSLETGLGNLVDADLARENAKLQALQIKQQLGLQTLAIANAQPQTLLSLFR
jgi:flagellin